uniref:Centriole, cilia and spindle-associated protein b n=1 Tax=Xiphophorus couchianus TaxID=32473 RepID=A0A3B5M3U4_9TELE
TSPRSGTFWIRSEYMKKFKDPKWETYTKCYEEMLAYRLTRRLLEHTHNPWFWSGSDSDSDSGGRSPPHPSKNQVEAGGAETEEPEVVKTDRQQETRTTGAGPRPTVQNEEAARPHQRKPSESTRPAWRSQCVRPVRQLKEDTKEKRHPFALYGSGEKDADIADRKTHNVGPAASTAEIHESALRAKTRRQVERQIQSQRPERRRAKSADPNKAGMAVQPEFNPWLTEYMRCFSARSR